MRKYLKKKKITQKKGWWDGSRYRPSPAKKKRKKKTKKRKEVCLAHSSLDSRSQM
jgi:hypothetical protein